MLAKLTLLHGGEVNSSAKDTFDFTPEYHYQVTQTKNKGYLFSQHFLSQELVEDGGESVCGGQYVLLELERCVPVVPRAVLIGSRSFIRTDRHSGFRRSGFGRSGLDVRGLDVRG